MSTFDTARTATRTPFGRTRFGILAAVLIALLPCAYSCVPWGIDDCDDCGWVPFGRVADAAYTYIYGFAPVTVMQTAYDQTHSTEDPVYAPINALYIDTETSTPDSQLWVTPNVNVIYSSSRLDLSAEPMVLFTPSIQDRYFSWDMMDAYTNAFNYVGSRATGGVEGTYALVGPDWQGDLPDGFTRVNGPTNSVWLVGRHEVMPGDDADRVTVIQMVQQSVLLPLSEFITRDPAYVNPIIDHPVDTVDGLNSEGLEFYYLLNEWMTDNPPPPVRDRTALERMARIGVGPGFTTDFRSLPLEQQNDLLTGSQLGFEIMRLNNYASGAFLNGWSYHLGGDFGDYGTNYLLRATIANVGLGGNVNEEAVYLGRLFGPHDMPLSGQRSYTLTFTADQLPVPINEKGFWSVTMYNWVTKRLVPNAINRYAIGSQNVDDMVLGPDGSLTIYIQRDSPGVALENNWLPSPLNDDRFYLVFRAYYPDPEVYSPADDPGWVVPNLERSDMPLP